MSVCNELGLEGVVSIEVMNEELTLRDSIRVRQAYAEMEFLGLIRVGRMASDWGLGILANSGGSYQASPLQPRVSNRGGQMGGFACMDCDFGDVVDRFFFVTRILPTIYAGFMFDWQNQGTASYRADQPYGQPRDLAEFDRQLAGDGPDLSGYLPSPERIAFEDDFEVVAFEEELERQRARSA